MLRPFFRRPPIAPASEPEVPAAEPPPAEPPRAEARPATGGAAVLDVIETDVLAAIGGVSASITAARGEVSAVQAGLAGIRAQMGGLAAAAREATGASAELTGHTDALSATSTRIGAAMRRAEAQLDAADGRGAEARAQIEALARAGAEIAGIIDAMAAVARQTNLLALNATIEAARAGAAGRGFAVVAAEVKALSVEAARAAEAVRTRLTGLCDGAAASASAIGALAEALDAARPSFAAVQAISAEQADLVARVAAEAGRAGGLVAAVDAEAGRVAVSSAALETGATATEASAREAADQAAGLGRRFVAVVRQSEIGDRRRHDRFPVELPVRLADGRRTRSVDLSEGGMLVTAPEGTVPAVGARIDLEVEGVGTLPATVAAVSAMGLHCAFGDLTAAARAGLGDRLDAVRAEYAPLIVRAQDIAGRIGDLMEAECAAGRLRVEALFDTAYRPLPGSDPRQFTTDGAAPLAALLQDLLDREVAADARMLFCIVTDRNGFIPVHNRAVSQPQRPGERAWNDAHCRNLRIFDDRTGITAARSQRPATVQVYRRTVGERIVMVREVDAPIRAAGRPWGACRTAYRY
ncbi:methyl-accepting chemotaxis protein [Methylobacterium sp. NEAU 140]|uniref:methyl-accepting chemotaxis protein n=1 Tax=Methylobacterium sp. NEAU 140 TaxID=3064945 RepID=UPI0027352BD1|nr:methyl-accepting chemotaxis protein [Methylobacterium sp. NEAU 140]MDP4024204.1 methyl-accepting chemotaxis protein [Methylobacterium sp. NEAU 140]